MTLTIKQVRKAMQKACVDTTSTMTKQAIDSFLNSISDLVDDDEMDLGELLRVFAGDVISEAFVCPHCEGAGCIECGEDLETYK